MGKKRSLLIIFLSIIILAAVIFIIFLSNKNSKLSFLSDDNRQVAFLKELYPDFISKNTNSGIANVYASDSFYTNFITYTNYNYENHETLENILKSYSTEEDLKNYTISTSFNIDTLTLSITLDNNDMVDKSTYHYKLGIDKKNNKITYKELDFKEHVIE